MQIATLCGRARDKQSVDWQSSRIMSLQRVNMEQGEGILRDRELSLSLYNCRQAMRRMAIIPQNIASYGEHEVFVASL